VVTANSKLAARIRASGANSYLLWQLRHTDLAAARAEAMRASSPTLRQRNPDTIRDPRSGVSDLPQKHPVQTTAAPAVTVKAKC